LHDILGGLVFGEGEETLGKGINQILIYIFLVRDSLVGVKRDSDLKWI